MASITDDSTEAFVDELLRINFKKQRAEAAKFANDLNARIETAEASAVARVKQQTKQLNEVLPAIDNSKYKKEAAGVDEETACATQALLDTVDDELNTVLQAHLDHFDRTLVDATSIDTGAEPDGNRDQIHAGHAFGKVQTLDVALADRLQHIVRVARKLIEKHHAEERKRAERKKTGTRARALVSEVAAALGSGTSRS